jgi:hypothetical protein
MAHTRGGTTTGRFARYHLRPQSRTNPRPNWRRCRAGRSSGQNRSVTASELWSPARVWTARRTFSPIGPANYRRMAGAGAPSRRIRNSRPIGLLRSGISDARGAVVVALRSLDAVTVLLYLMEPIRADRNLGSAGWGMGMEDRP